MNTELKLPAFPHELRDVVPKEKLAAMIGYWAKLLLLERLGHNRKIYSTAYRRVDSLSYGLIVSVDNQEFSCEVDQDLSDWWPFYSMLTEIDLTI